MIQSTLIGLVLAGGESVRMHQDKGLLNYHGLPQREYLYRLLQPYCEKVFICCKKKQAETLSPGIPALIDESDGIGPVAAIISAFHQYPKASFLVIGCDYPLFDAEHLQLLLSHRNTETDAVVFKNPATGIAEALLGIYENRCLARLEAEVLAGHYSLRYFLQQIQSKTILPLREECIHSIDTPDDYKKLRNKLSR